MIRMTLNIADSAVLIVPGATGKRLVIIQSTITGTDTANSVNSRSQNSSRAIYEAL